MTSDADHGSHVPPAPVPPAWAPPEPQWGPPSAPPPAGATWAGPPSAGATWPAPPVAGRRSGRFARTALVAVPALLVGAGAATVITLGLVGHHASTTTAASGTAATSTAAHHRTGKDGTVGTLTSTDGSTWTLKTAKGSVPVDIGSSTTFGSRAHPSQESAFHTGEKVRVAGTTSGSTVDASRVVAVGASSSAGSATS